MTRSMAVAFVVLAACDPPRQTEGDAAPPRSAPTAPAPASTTPAVQPLGVTLTAIRKHGDAVEIEVALDRKLPPTGGSRPTLQIGEQTFRRSRRADGQLDRLIFYLSAAELDALEDGATMIVRDRMVSSEQLQSPPRLDKSKLVVTP
ncbi:MAG TPA: hypothetical protein VG755_09350 [Nannocystaceae bacterium]|nr:hypothetical protein [Nannocystaceae bacterium]